MDKEKIDNIISNAGVTTKEKLQQQQAKQQQAAANKPALLNYIRSNVIGSQTGTVFKTIYGEKPLVYADYTASGKNLKFIEDYIQTQIMPLYANTHSLQSGTGKQTIHAREEARQIIKRTCGADQLDVCIFTGTGSTSASNLLIDKIRIRDIVKEVEAGTQVLTKEEVDKVVSSTNFCEMNRFHSYDCKLCKTIMPSLGAYEKHCQSKVHTLNLEQYKNNFRVYTDKPVVFLSVYEHNANLIPWRETGATIVLIPMTSSGDFDYEALEQKLAEYRQLNTLKVGSFSAGSNITGTVFDVDRISVLCHKAGCLAFFDYAATCPYQDINMSGVTNHGFSKEVVGPLGFKPIPIEDQKYAYKDAVFLSPHKLVGGPGSSGVLLAKKSIITNCKPQRLGGGIVFFVNELEHDFLPDKQEREESGTPGIIQDIRAGLAFQLKESVGCDTISKREHEINEAVLKRFKAIGNLFLLGNNELPKVAIYTFIIKTKKGKILHPNFVCSLLNDLFGIQSRAGCQCSSIVGQQVLGIDLNLSREYKEALMSGEEVLRMGFTRVNFNYFFNDEDVNYICDAIEFIAEYGWLFLPHYKFDQDLGYWINRDETEQKQRSWLGEVDYSSGEMTYLKSTDPSLRGSFPFFNEPNVAKPLNEYFDLAKEALVKTVEQYKTIYGKSMVDQRLLIAEQFKKLIWFTFPSEVLSTIFEMKYDGALTFEAIRSFVMGLKKQEDEEWTTPYQPKNYNLEQYAYEFSQEYLSTQKASEEVEVQPGEAKPVVAEPVSSPLAEKEEEKKSEPEEEQKPEAKQDDGYGEEEEEEFPFAFGDLETQAPSTKKPKIKLLEISKEVKAQVGAAIRDYEMIKDGDRVLIALSGGKDSLTMIHILKYFQSVAPIKFELGAVTIDPMVNEYKPQPLIPYMESIGVPYFLESDAIVERAKTCMNKNSICAFCARMKRGMIYNCARREGYNVIAMGQHLDDLAESFVMSVFHNGHLRTMKASYTIDAGDLRVIRPLVTCREALFKDFSEKNQLPIIADNCPACFSAPKERHRIKLMLAQQEHLFPSLFQSILKSIDPLMRGNINDGILLGNKKEGDASDDEEFDGALGKRCTMGACPL